MVFERSSICIQIRVYCTTPFDTLQQKIGYFAAFCAGKCCRLRNTADGSLFFLRPLQLFKAGVGGIVAVRNGLRDGGGAVLEDAQLDLARVSALGFVDVEAGFARALGLQADEDLIKEYIQHPKIAEDFSAYLDLYYKYRDDYGVEEILAGQAKPAVFARLLQAPFDERLSLVSLLLAGLNTRFAASRQADAVADACYAFLRETKKALATLPDDVPDGSAELFSQQIADYDAETQHQRDAGLLSHDALTTRLQVQAVLRR